MGLRGFFNSVRKKDGGQNRPNTGNEAPTTTTINTQPSISKPTTQTTSSTAFSVNPPYVKRDLWDEAYEVLRAENEDLIQKYEEIIVEHDKQNAGSTVQQLG
jgi:16S rRNA G966 N2-methylase RsmD